MGKLLHTYADGPELMTRPHFFEPGQTKAARKVIKTLVRVSYDASDTNYQMVLGRLRRKPETLPQARRVKR